MKQSKSNAKHGARNVARLAIKRETILVLCELQLGRVGGGASNVANSCSTDDYECTKTK